MDSKINWIILVLFSPFDTNEAKLLDGTFERMNLIRIFVESQQYIIAATWDTYESKFEKTKKSTGKKILIFQEIELSLPPKNFLKLSSPQNLIKCFNSLDKTPLGETGCLSNLYYLLAAQAFRIHFQNCSLIKCIFQNCFL